MTIHNAIRRHMTPCHEICKLYNAISHEFMKINSITSHLRNTQNSTRPTRYLLCPGKCKYRTWVVKNTIWPMEFHFSEESMQHSGTHDDHNNNDDSEDNNLNLNHNHRHNHLREFGVTAVILTPGACGKGVPCCSRWHLIHGIRWIWCVSQTMSFTKQNLYFS